MITLSWSALLVANPLLVQFGLEDNAHGWAWYLTYLSELAGDPAEQERQGFAELSHGWAIGTLGWKRAVARDSCHLRREAGLLRYERRELKEIGWRTALIVDRLLGGKPRGIELFSIGSSSDVPNAALLAR